MKNILIKLFCLVLLMFFSMPTRSFVPLSYAQQYTEQTKMLEKELSTLNLKNPEIDMENNYANGDMRFIGVYGWMLFCPGVPESDQALEIKYGVRPIKGTGDFIESEKHEQLINAATK